VDEGDGGVAPVVKEDARVGQGGAAGSVGGDGAERRERLGFAVDQEQGADALFGSDGASGKDAQRRVCGQRGDGDQADVGLAGSQAVGALGGQHAVDTVAAGELGLKRRVLEIPHQRRGIEEVDGGDAQARLWGGIHCYLEYQHRMKDSVSGA